MVCLPADPSPLAPAVGAPEHIKRIHVENMLDNEIYSAMSSFGGQGSQMGVEDEGRRWRLMLGVRGRRSRVVDS